MRLWLHAVTLVAVVASAIGLLDGELFYLSLVRANESFNGSQIRHISSLYSGEPNITELIGALSNTVTAKVLTLLYEPGVFGLYFLLLSISAVVYFIVLSRISQNHTLAFILSILGMIGVVSSTRDISIAAAVFLSCLEFVVLTDRRGIVRLLVIPLCILHYCTDTSYLLPLSVYLIGTSSRLGVSLGILSLLFSSLIVSNGYPVSPYTISTSLLLGFFGMTLAFKSRNTRVICFSLLTPILLCFWQGLNGQRFPAISFLMPAIVAYIWVAVPRDTKGNFETVLKSLQKQFSLSQKNRLAFALLCFAFIFFQTVTRIKYPLNEAYLPKEAMDLLSEAHPIGPPLHPVEVGGYVAYRLAPILAKNRSLNYFDMSAKPILLSLSSRPFDEYKKIIDGTNPEFFNRLDPRYVLCRGKDRLCTQLKADSQWMVLSHSSVAGRIIERFQNLPAEQLNYLEKKLEEQSWYLLARQEPSKQPAAKRLESTGTSNYSDSLSGE